MEFFITNVFVKKMMEMAPDCKVDLPHIMVSCANTLEVPALMLGKHPSIIVNSRFPCDLSSRLLNQWTLID
jgi:hypothetical protein